MIIEVGGNIQVIVATQIRQLGRESMIYGLAGAITSMIGVFLIPIYTRIFAPGDYGIAAIIDTFVSVVSICATFGVPDAAVRWYNDSNDPQQQQKIISSWFWFQFVSSSVLAGGIILFAAPVAQLLCGRDDCTIIVRLAFLTLPANTASVVFVRWLRYQRRPWQTIGFTVTMALFTVAIVFLFVVVLRQGLPGLFTARLVSTSAGSLVSIFLLWNWLNLKAVSFVQLKGMFRYGVPIMLASLALWGILYANRFVLDFYHGKAQLGLYAIAGSIAGAAQLVVASFQQAYVPFAFSILSHEHADRVYAKIFDVYAFIGCTLCTTITIFAPLFLSILANENYYAAATCVGFLTYVNLLDGAKSIATLGPAIAKKSLPVLTSLIVGALVNIALAVILVPAAGKEGAAFAVMIGYLATVILLFKSSQQYHYLPYRWRPALMCLALSWTIMGIDHWLSLPMDIYGFIIRGGMLTMFIPLGLALGLVRLENIKQTFCRTQAAKARYK